MDDNFRDKLFFLTRYDKVLQCHTGITFLEHLIGTYDLLTNWQEGQYVCDAGLFHSVYGTSNSDNALIHLSKRNELKALLGEEAEQLIYVYCYAQPSSLYCAVQASKKSDSTNYDLMSRNSDVNAKIHRVQLRYGQSSVRVSDAYLDDMCQLIFANWFEQAQRQEIIEMAAVKTISAVVSRLRPLPRACFDSLVYA